MELQDEKREQPVDASRAPDENTQNTRGMIVRVQIRVLETSPRPQRLPGSSVDPADVPDQFVDSNVEGESGKT